MFNKKTLFFNVFWLLFNLQFLTNYYNYFRIQEIDDGFFEKFGSLLRQQSVKAAMYESAPLAPLIEEPTIPEESPQTASDATVAGEAPPEDLANDTQLDEADRSSENVDVQLQPRFGLDPDDSGNETLHESDSEPDVGKLEWFEGPIGWNVSSFISVYFYRRSKITMFKHLCQYLMDFVVI